MAATVPNFFVDYKKGEVNEIKAILRHPSTTRDPAKTTEILKKVVALMTMGVDLSELFPDIIMCSRTKDVVQKKLIYLYITHYAHVSENQDTALLAVNTLQSDCQDDDPTIRGLALRSLCSLRVGNLSEYCVKCVAAGLSDHNAYVRRAAVMGVIKTYHIAPNSVNTAEYIDKLYALLRDRDPQVVVNAIFVLDEMLEQSGGMQINKAIVHHLLNRLREFSEWQQSTVLSLVSRYQPQDDEELFDIMNLLEDTFRNSNSGLVLAATKVFLNISQTKPQIHEQVLMRLKTPLITLMAGGAEEVSFAILCHIKLLVAKSPHIFAEDYKHFFSRGNDSTSIKSLKSDVLVAIVSDINVTDVVNELSEYVTDIDITMARNSIRAIGRVGFNVPQSLKQITHTLLSFLPLAIPHVSSETVSTIAMLLRKYPEIAEEVVEECAGAFSSVHDDPGRIALVWIVGEYGERVSEAPYLLESIIATYDDESVALKNELLNASVKLFFKRPAEMRPPLGVLLTSATQDSSHADTHDRALYYFRLLQNDVNEAKRVVLTPTIRVAEFPEENVLELQDRLFEEFNSLSVVFNKPSDEWYVPLESKDNNDDDDDDDNDHAAAEPDQHSPEWQSSRGDLNCREEEGGELALMALDADASLHPDHFERNWTALKHQESFSGQMTSGFSEPQELVDSLATMAVQTLAFGDQNGQLKFYCYAKLETRGVFVLCEVVVVLSELSYSVAVKSEDGGASSEFAKWFAALLAHL